LISVPVRNGEAFGMYLLESMASGVPVVQPALGAFPEIISLSKGGITYQPNTPEELSKNLAQLLSDSAKMEQLSADARKGVESKFDIYDHAKAMIEIYSKILAH
jgi:glycosyltransferase involved in cell wall biosynthesis